MSNSSIRRRDFVAGATAAATGVALAGKSFASTSNSIHDLTHEDFVQLIGQSFSAEGLSEQGVPQRGTLVLKEVAKHEIGKEERPSHLRQEGFSLQFESQDSALAGGTLQVAGGTLPRQAVFVQEMLDQQSPGHRHFEAVFN